MNSSEHKKTEKLLTRLSKIEGHIRGIKKMIESSRSCQEILIQFSAVQSALTSTGRLLLEDHLQECIINKEKDKNLKIELENFKNTLNKYIKSQI